MHRVDDEEDYEPVLQQIFELNDDNFEEITNMTSLRGSDTWFVLFHRDDEASKIVLEELQKLVTKKRLYHVKVGVMNFNGPDATANTEFRFNLNNVKSFELILFKAAKVGSSEVISSKMYLYSGPKSYENM